MNSAEDRRSTSSTFSEVETLLVMCAVWAAVAAPVSMPRIIGAALLALGLVGRSKVTVVVGLLVVASATSALAERAYRPAERATLHDEPATVVFDAEPMRFGWRAEVRLDASGQRVRLIGSGFDAPDLVAGEQIVVSGRLGPIDAGGWAKSRHLVGVVTVTDLRSVAGPAWYLRPGEWLRRGVLGSTQSFDPDARALYHGLVIGDDRFQSEGQQAQFRAAGLSHLLAVSGQNVAFLLAVCGPLLRRLRPGADVVAVAVLLAVFAIATRLEPSVLRATATAAIGVLATANSSRAAGVRALGLAVIVLLMIDPFLSRSVGFQLSVAASLGILLLSTSFRHRLPLADAVAEPLAITLAAQCGVSPILLATFGPLSTVTIPANVLAGWAAGAVMTLGLSVGLVAAVVPDPLGSTLQLPARVLVWWIDEVAAHAAVAPLPSVAGRDVPLLVFVAACAWLVRPTRWPLAGPLLAVALTIVWMIPANRSQPLPGWHPAANGRPSVLVIDGAEPAADGVIAARITSIDVLVVGDGGWTTARMIDRLRDIVRIDVVLAPGDHRIVGGRRVLVDTVVDIDGGRIEISPSRSGLDIVTVVDGAGSG